MALNVVALVGRITADPELRSTPNGTNVCAFCIAVDEGKDKEASFFDCVAWRHTAEFISKYFQKGSAIAISGSLHQRRWDDKEGRKRSTVEITVSEASFAGSKEKAEQAPARTGGDFAVIDEGEEDLPF